MSHHFQLPWSDSKALPGFPSRCVCCGAPKQTESTLVLTRLVMRGQPQKPLELKFQIPHCQRCARSTKVIFLAGCIPFVLGLLTVGLCVFLIVTYGAAVRGLDDYGTPNNANSIVLGAAAGLFAGLFGGFLFELLARVILLPILGRGLLAAPLLAIQFIKDSDYVAGLSGRLDREGRNVHLEFANASIAEEFRTLNSL